MPLTDDEHLELTRLNILLRDPDIQRAARLQSPLGERFFQLFLRRATLEQQKRAPAELPLLPAESPGLHGTLTRMAPEAELGGPADTAPEVVMAPVEMEGFPPPQGVTLVDLIRALMARRPVTRAPVPEVPTTNFAIPLEESLRLGQER